MKATSETAVRQKGEYGDWQTNLPLALSVCEYIKSQGVRPQVIIEPTCGQGNFIVAALLTFDSIEAVYGIEIYKPYLDALKARLRNFDRPLEHVAIHLFHESIFEFDFRKMTEHIGDKTVLAIGNPPWVTNTKLGELGSGNLPVKTNFKKTKGIDAITGKANFDIAEYISIQLMEKLSGKDAYFAFLLKNSVIKNLIYEQKTGKLPLAQVSQFHIDAQKEFCVSVAASLLFMRLSGGHEKSCRVFDFYTKAPVCRYGWTDGKFVANIDDYARTKAIDGASPFGWRSGLKHDCSKVMELSKVDGHYVNALGEIVDVEDDVVFPLIKSSDIKDDVISQTRKYVLVTQHNTNEDTMQLRTNKPKTYQYLVDHAAYLDNRKSSIYKGRPRFCMFGIGDYTFKKYKVVISGLYKQAHFSLLSEIDGKVAVCDDTCYMLGFDDYGVAMLARDILNSPQVQEFISSICFYDAKRVINKEMLMRINLLSALNAMDERQVVGLSREAYQAASRFIARRSTAVASQQSILFPSLIPY